MNNNSIKIVSDYLKKIEENLKVLDEKQKTLRELEEEIKTARLNENVGNEELGQKIDDSQKLKKEIKGLEKLSLEYNVLSKFCNEKFKKLDELRAKVDKNINDVLYSEAPTKFYKTSTEEEKIEFEMLKPRYESEIEFIKNSMNDLIESLEKLEQKTKNAIKGKDDNYRDLTLEEAENQNEKKDENFRELTYKEARSIVNYGNRFNNGELSEEEIIKYKPRLDNLMKETGAQDMNELYEKAREVVNKNKSNINNSTEKQAEFINKKDVSELNEEEKNHIRETLGLDDDEEITNDDLSKVQAEDIANSKEKRKPAKKISIAGEKLKEKIEKNGPKILKTVGAVVLVGVAIATGFTLVPGLAAAGAGALGVAAYQEFNKGKKL